MIKKVLFIHGAGEGAYTEDQLIARSLQEELGQGFKIICPAMPDENNAPYDLWKQRIVEELEDSAELEYLVGHSIGASHLMKILSEIKLRTDIKGVYLLAAPYWGGDGWTYEGYEKLQISKDAGNKVPDTTKIYLYHSHDDEVVPFNHQHLYSKLLPQATVRQFDKGGHQLKGIPSVLAADIRSL